MPDKPTQFDQDTFAFYAKNADLYAQRRTKVSQSLSHFLQRLSPGARILEIGCGAGLEAQYMQSQGFDILATEGNPKLGAYAQQKLGDKAKILRFDEIDFDNEFDGIWANMCLLHAPWDELPTILRSLQQALKQGGLLMASFKKGDGPKRDKLGRYYNLPTEDDLRTQFAQIPWQSLSLHGGIGGVGCDGEPYEVVWCEALK